VAGEHDRPVAGQYAAVARVPGTGHGRQDMLRDRGLVARLRRDVDELERPRREPARQLFVAHAPDSIVEPVRYCGIDVAAKASGQQLCTLHERRGPDGIELVATFFEPGDVDAVAGTVLGFGGEAVVAIDAPSGRRLDLLAPGSPLRDELGLPAGRYERSRVCDALLFRRGLPLYPVPAAEQALARWESWMDSGFALFAALEPLRLFRPPAQPGAMAPVGDGAVRFGRLCETYPDAVFCSLLGHRPSAKRTPWGLQQRIAALRLRGVVDDDGGLWHRTLDELDACAAAYAAFALANGSGSWVGDPREGVIVLPGDGLLERYAKLPPPRRQTLA